MTTTYEGDMVFHRVAPAGLDDTVHLILTTITTFIVPVPGGPGGAAVTDITAITLGIGPGRVDLVPQCDGGILYLFSEDPHTMFAFVGQPRP